MVIFKLCQGLIDHDSYWGRAETKHRQEDDRIRESVTELLVKWLPQIEMNTKKVPKNLHKTITVYFVI